MSGRILVCATCNRTLVVHDDNPRLRWWEYPDWPHSDNQIRQDGVCPECERFIFGDATNT